MSKFQIAMMLALLAALCWAGNQVMGRFVRDTIPPIGLTFWRWTMCATLLTPFALPKLLKEWPIVRRNWKLLFGLGLLGSAMFQAMVYIGLHTTTAINGLLLNSTGPVFTLFIAMIVLKEKATLRQFIGIAVSFCGVAWLVLRGDLGSLGALQFTVGDIWIVGAMFVWGLYSVLLRFRPSGLSDLTLVYIVALVAAFMLSPLMVWEVSRGQVVPLNMQGILAVGYVAVFASIVAFLSFNAAVARIGPTKAVTFLHFIPVFGTILAIVFLGERLASYHLTGFAVVMVGVYLATMGKTNAPDA
ncbi:DMT family transporter [Actibacterium pelagium]|uniref:DMT family transporter n=1 Tax=Actibacterium pelagium TaxID=2029103 RepID=UPI001666DBDA|nr:DMT family transporter [Actibacterium pelagium]